MRGFVESRSLAAAALTKRVRCLFCARNYSAGIGRGRGEGLGNFGDTKESVFSSSYGHGVPLNSAGRGCPLSAGFSDRRGPRNLSPGTPNTNFGLQSGWQPIEQTDMDARVKPIEQTDMDARVQPQPFPYVAPSTGWHQPIHYDARLQMQPSMQHPPPTGWQQSAGMGEPYPKRAVSSELELGKPYQGTPDGSMEQPSHFSSAPRELAQEGVAKSYPEATYLFNNETEQSQWASNTPETNQQTHAAYAMGDWRSFSTGESMEPPYPSQNFPESNQGQYLYGSEAVKPPSVAPDTSDVSGYEYYWGQHTSESFQDSKEQLQVEAPIHVDKGLHYDERIEECFKQGKLEDIDDIYNQMRAAQVKASAKTYGTILQSYMQLGKMDKASRIYQEMSGVLFSDKKVENDRAKQTSSAASRESPTLHQIEGVASSAEISSAVQGAPYGAEFEENRGFTPLRTNSKKDSLSASSNTDAQGFSSFGRSDSFGKTGMGRGKKMDSFFNFDFSGGSASGGGTHYGKENIEVDQGSNSEMHDDYNQTFTPVIERGWHAFAPQGISVGPDAQGFSSFGRSESIGKTGMGRGKKMDSFFNFDFSGGSASGGGTHYEKENIEVDQGSNSEMQDDYNQTFTPVIEPGWHHAFAPQGISVGPGAGRGRPHSHGAGDSGIGSSMPFPSQQFDSGAGRSHEQRMQVALQQSPPLYSRDVPAEPQHEYPEEPSQPWISTEEAAERAMRILNAGLSRRYKKVEGWERSYDDDATRVRRRSPVQLTQAKSLNEKKQPKKRIKVEKEIHLTDEEAKKEAERLKAIEENEALQELHYTLEQFMKCYGEMALEPEHELGDFTNPDIEEKPFMPLEEYLQKAKPNIMKTGLIRSEKEWQNMVDETLKHAPYFEEFVERYSGPGRYTAKQENEDLEEIASTLPSDVGRGAKAFVQRSLTTLKSNPGFNLDEKQWMLSTMVEEFSQFAVTI